MEFFNSQKKNDDPSLPATERIEPVAGEVSAQFSQENAPWDEVEAIEDPDMKSVEEHCPSEEDVREEPATDVRQDVVATPPEERPLKKGSQEAFVNETARAKTKKNNRNASAEEIAARMRTRHRLVGAAAILMAVVIAAPFILDEEANPPRPAIETSIPVVSSTQAPLSVPSDHEKNGGDVDLTNSTIAPIQSTAQANLSQEASNTTKAAKETQEKVSVAPKTVPAKKPVAVEKVDKTGSVSLPPPKGAGYYIQVLATSSERGADKKVKDLALLGLPAYKEAVKRQSTTLWRVRVGLYKTKKEAEGASGTLMLNGHSKVIISRQDK